MYYLLQLFIALNAFLAFASASCDLAFCVNQFCPPSVGDVGWCLCLYSAGTEISGVIECLDQECGTPTNINGNSLVATLESNALGCCDQYVLAYPATGFPPTATPAYLPLNQFSMCAGIMQNAGQSGCTPYSPSYSWTSSIYSIEDVKDHPYLCTDFLVESGSTTGVSTGTPVGTPQTTNTISSTNLPSSSPNAGTSTTTTSASATTSPTAAAAASSTTNSSNQKSGASHQSLGRFPVFAVTCGLLVIGLVFFLVV